MEDNGTADKSVYPTLTAEQNPEESHELVAKENQEIPADDGMKYTPTVVHGGATPSIRLVSILFWSNFASVLLLLVGFVAPGWLTFTTEHRLIYEGYNTRHIGDIYQDYALWYINQCDSHEGKNMECVTMTYRSISGIYAEAITKYDKLEIANLQNEGDDKFILDEAGLVFGYSKFVLIETLYTIGLLISFILLYKWYDLRKEIVKGTCSGPSKWMWMILILLTILAVIFIFIGVFIFVAVRGDIEAGRGVDVELGTPLGMWFAVFGGCFLIVVGVTELVQALCCSSSGDRILEN